MIDEGVKEGDKIVLEGVRQVRDGEKWNTSSVQPEEVLSNLKYTRQNRNLLPMFTKILHRPALAIVISLIILFLGVLAIDTLPYRSSPPSRRRP